MAKIYNRHGFSVPAYVPVRKCASFWTWLYFWPACREPRICGWDFYGWRDYPTARLFFAR
jgi:hypothetical protein